MMRTLTLRAGLMGLVIALAAGCAPPKKTADILNFEALRQEEYAKTVQDRFPDLFKASEAEYKRAVEYHNDGDEDEALHHIRMASVYWRTAVSRSRIKDAQDSRLAAQNRIRHSQEALELSTTRRDRVKAAVARMNRVKKLTLEMQAQKARLEQEKKAKKAAGMVNDVLVKLKEAEAMDAARHAPGELNKAQASFQNAQTALTKGNYREAERLADIAMKDTQAIIAVAKPKYDLEQQERAIEARLKALQEAAGGVPGAETRLSKMGLVLSMSAVFKRKKTNILPDRQLAMGQLAKLAKEFPEFKLLLETHTDNRGRADRNQNITGGQAQTAMAYLVENGVEPGRMTAIGKGEAEPIAENSTRSGRTRNRRLDIIFLRPAAAATGQGGNGGVVKPAGQ